MVVTYRHGHGFKLGYGLGWGRGWGRGRNDRNQGNQEN